MMGNTSKRILHVAGNELLKSSGFSQQFFMEVLGLKRRGYDVSVLAFCHIKFFRKRVLLKRLRERYCEKGIKIHIIPSLFVGRYLIEFLFYPIALTVVACFIFARNVELCHVHSQNYMPVFLPFKLSGRIKLFQDLHGAIIEEGLYSNLFTKNSVFHRYLNFKEKLAMRFSDVIFCVSQNMIEYYTVKHTLPLTRFRLTRSSFDPDIFSKFSYALKEQAKEQLSDLKGKTVLLYMGHKTAWELTANVVDLFVELKKHFGDLRIIFLSDDKGGILTEARNRGISEDECIIRFVSHKEVPKYSYAADVAIVIRADSIVNRVSSPVKFSEYLASGALVLVSPCVGDLPAIVTKNEIGFVLGENPDGEAACFLKQALSNKENRNRTAERCRNVAEDEFSIQRTLAVFMDAYESIKVKDA